MGLASHAEWVLEQHAAVAVTLEDAREEDGDNPVLEPGPGATPLWPSVQVRGLFEAVAHRNPFPRERFDQNRWNQMVLKALFVDSTLHPMQGLDDRANPELAHILCDYAHERWAAGRAVSPELWRCVGPFAVGCMLDDLRKVLSDGNATERKAAALALSASPSAKAREIMAGAADLAQLIESGDLFWDGLVNE